MEETSRHPVSTMLHFNAHEGKFLSLEKVFLLGKTLVRRYVKMSPFPPSHMDKEQIQAISKKSKAIQALQNITVHFRKDCQRSVWGYISARQWHL